MRRQYERYRKLFSRCRHEAQSSTDRLSDYVTYTHRLHDSEILNCLWTADEKETFFTALARCGKGNLAEIAKRIGTKSLAEVAGYVGVLDEATRWRKNSARALRFFSHAKIPGAIEVDEEWLKFESTASTRCIQNESNLQPQDLDEESFILNIEKAQEVAQWYDLCYFYF